MSFKGVGIVGVPIVTPTYGTTELNKDNAIDPDTMVGQNVCVNLQLADGRHRHFNGYVSSRRVDA